VPVPPTPPDGRNIVDAFIRAELAKHQLQAVPEADRRILIRRLSFDLIGLPPTPAEVQQFILDDSPTAYEALVERLLASPRYGERWARHWMDAIHFAETHGHDQDRIRENAWPYRDYLIASLNADKPYDRFIQEQIAGDTLFPDDPQATVALGFLAAGPWDESSLRDIREDTFDRQIGRYLDRDDILATVMNNVASVTVQCARCHDHKFDPIPQAEYYSLQAVFAGVDRANREYDADPQVHRERQRLREAEIALEKLAPEMKARLLSTDSQQQVVAWEQSLGSASPWVVTTPDQWTTTEGSTLELLADDSLYASGKAPDRETYSITVGAPAGKLRALRLEVLTDERLPQRGPGRASNGNFHLNEIELLRGDANGPKITFAQAKADFDQESWEVAKAIDGNSDSAWGIHPEESKPHAAVFEFKEPLDLREETKVTVVLKQVHGRGHVIGRLRLSFTESEHPILLGVIPDRIAKILSVRSEDRTDEQRIALAQFQQRQMVAKRLNALPKPSYVYAAASDFEPDGGLKPAGGPRLVQVLRRGDIRQPLEEAKPGALSCIAEIPSRFEIENIANESARRAELARWLTHPQNPLPWRTIVNRVWHHHFGRGLVATVNDFGRMGSTPTHPELLDWLAMWFRDEGQSLKELHRLIVCSATYRQQATAGIDLQHGRDSALRVSTDSENRLLWRMNRTRLDAECVRDSILAISDRLESRMGGPGDRQFDMQPGRHVTPILNYQKFDLDTPAGRRRSIYRFLFRTLPDPLMESLDCPAGDQMTPVRTNTVTVQQALAMWNDAFVIRHCEHFAQRLEKIAPTTPQRVTTAFQFCFSREPSGDELKDFVAYCDKHGLANFCRLLFNSNEFMFVN
jgi:hypothetical protein